MNYEAWNQRLAEHFFPTDAGARKVTLHCTPALLHAIHPSGYDGFVEAIRAGPAGATYTGHCMRAWRLHEGWDRKSIPPFLAYLVSFVLAWTLEDPSWAKLDYYGRLRRVLGEEQGEGVLPSFQRMDLLWHALAEWSTDAQDASRGVFEARTVGPWIHVGYPQSQAFFSGHQRLKLHQAFAKSALSPFEAYSDHTIARSLLDHARPALSNAQFAMLAGSEGRETLLQAVRQELEAWRPEDLGAPAPQFAMAVEASWEARHKRISFFLRVRTNEPLPEEGLDLERSDGLRAFAEAEAPGLTSRLIESQGHIPVNGIPIKGLVWKVLGSIVVPPTVEPRELFVFGTAERFGISTYIERPTLPTHGKFLVLGRAELVQSAHASLVEQGTPCSEPHVAYGLPPTWSMFSGTATGTPAPDESFAPPRDARILLVGGIRVKGGNTFFSFAPPRAIVEGPGITSVRVNGQHHAPEEPVALPGTPGEHSVEGWRNESLVATARVRITEAQPHAGTALTSLGTTTSIVEDIPDGWKAWPSNKPTSILIGQEVGQVALLDEGRAWEPTWLIERGKKCVIHFVGATLSRPQMNSHQPREALREWAQWTWNIRRRARVSGSNRLRKLWTLYVEAGKLAK